MYSGVRARDGKRRAAAGGLGPGNLLITQLAEQSKGMAPSRHMQGLGQWDWTAIPGHVPEAGFLVWEVKQRAFLKTTELPEGLVGTAQQAPVDCQ